MKLGRSILLNVLNTCIKYDISFGEYFQFRSESDVFQVSPEKMTENEGFSRSTFFLDEFVLSNLANHQLTS